MFLVTWDDDDVVYAQRYAIPVADFSGSPLTGTAPLTVTFSNSSLPLTYITAYTWTFGDGATSTLTNPVHSYTQTGSYTVTLTTAVVTETDTLTRTSYITVSAGGCVTPTAGFSGSPLTVSFADASSGTISGRWWSFGDEGSSSETDPGHSYTQTGVFTLCSGPATDRRSDPGRPLPG
jgi:PKD repeat protein